MRVEFVNLRQAGLGLLEAATRLTALHWQRGKRVLILAQDDLQAQEVDRLLWTQDPASFLPHAQAGGQDEAQEPILVACDPANRNQASVLVMLAPLEPGAERLADYEHLIDFVPREEGPPLAAARERYKKWQGAAGVDLVHTTSLGG